jgi:dTDP-4-amino-4,6-dideoxygalactose transaminase
MIDLFYPYVPTEAIQEVSDTLKSRFIGQGTRVDKFEKDFEKKFDVKYAVSLNSGTSALETAYDILNLNEGDEVISTPLTCTATNLPLIHRGVKIVWADISPDTLCIDPKDIKRKLTGRTKAIVNVHLGGVENDIGEQPVPIIADSAQALGIFKGDYVCCSFQAIKHITTGDGGMLICPNEQDYRKAKLMRWFGIDREAKQKANWQAYKTRQMTFDIEMVGYKRQMTDIAAGMGIVGLRHYDRIIEHRTRLANLYSERLKSTDVKVINAPKNTWWLFTVLVEDRDNFAKLMTENGIDTNLVQVRNDLYRIFGGKRADLPILNYIESRYISLPLTMKTTEEDVCYITDVIRRGW